VISTPDAKSFCTQVHKICEDTSGQDIPCKAILRSLAALGVILEEWPADIGRPDPQIPYHTDLVRLELYGRFAAEAESRGIKRLFATDTKDVFFQSDPFATLTDEELHLFEESIEIGTEGINAQWLESCYGKELTATLKDKKVLCSGTVAGTPKGIKAYSRALLKLFSEGFRNSGSKCLVGDQAMLNLAHERQLFEIPSLKVWPNADIVATLGTAGHRWLNGCAKGQCGWVLNNQTQQLIPVIHQYQSKPPIGVALIGTLYTSQTPMPRDMEYQPRFITQLRGVFHNLQESNLAKMLSFARHNLKLDDDVIGDTNEDYEVG